MTVTNEDSYGPLWCQWFMRDSSLAGGEFPAETLVLVDEEES